MRCFLININTVLLKCNITHARVYFLLHSRVRVGIHLTSSRVHASATCVYCSCGGPYVWNTRSEQCSHELFAQGCLSI